MAYNGLKNRIKNNSTILNPNNSEYLSLINLARVKQISVEEQFNLNEHLTWITKNKLIKICLMKYQWPRPSRGAEDCRQRPAGM